MRSPSTALRASLLAALLASLLVPAPASASGVYPCGDGTYRVDVGGQNVVECGFVSSCGDGGVQVGDPNDPFTGCVGDDGIDDVFRVEDCPGGFRYYILDNPSPCFR